MVYGVMSYHVIMSNHVVISSHLSRSLSHPPRWHLGSFCRDDAQTIMNAVYRALKSYEIYIITYMKKFWNETKELECAFDITCSDFESLKFKSANLQQSHVFDSSRFLIPS